MEVHTGDRTAAMTETQIAEKSFYKSKRHTVKTTWIVGKRGKKGITTLPDSTALHGGTLWKGRVSREEEEKEEKRYSKLMFVQHSE